MKAGKTNNKYPDQRMVEPGMDALEIIGKTKVRKRKIDRTVKMEEYIFVLITRPRFLWQELAYLYEHNSEFQTGCQIRRFIMNDCVGLEWIIQVFDQV
jgi:hypothetical protein